MLSKSTKYSTDLERSDKSENVLSTKSAANSSGDFISSATDYVSFLVNSVSSAVNLVSSTVISVSSFLHPIIKIIISIYNKNN